MAITIVPTFTPTPNPLPKMDIIVSGITGSPATASLFRIWEGREEVVPGQEKIKVIGTTIAMADAFHPLGIGIIYKVVTYNVSGGRVEVGQTGQVYILHLPGIYISDPQDESSWSIIEMKSGSFSKFEYQRQGEIIPIRGSAYPSLVSGIRQAASGMPFAIITDLDNFQRILKILQNADPFCLRVPKNEFIIGSGGQLTLSRDFLSLPSVMFLSIATLSVEPFGGGADEVIIQGTADEVSPPTNVSLVPQRTYNTVLLDPANPAYIDVPFNYFTYLQMMRGY